MNDIPGQLSKHFYRSYNISGSDFNFEQSSMRSRFVCFLRSSPIYHIRHASPLQIRYLDRNLPPMAREGFPWCLKTTEETRKHIYTSSEEVRPISAHLYFEQHHVRSHPTHSTIDNDVKQLRCLEHISLHPETKYRKAFEFISFRLIL